MNKSVLILLLGSIFLLGARKDGERNKFVHNIITTFKTGCFGNSSKSITTVNGRRIRCICGGNPVMLITVYEHCQGYCVNHMPQLSLPSFKINDTLRKLK